MTEIACAGTAPRGTEPFTFSNSSFQPSLLTGTLPRIAMSEIIPGRYWVMINFPGRSSVDLAIDVDFERATTVMATAQLVCAEGLACAVVAANAAAEQAETDATAAFNASIGAR